MSIYPTKTCNHHSLVRICCVHVARLICVLFSLNISGAYAEEENMQALPVTYEVGATQSPISAYYPADADPNQSKPLMQPIKTAEEQKSLKYSSISLMADASLITPISLIARDFSRKHHVPVALDFGSTKEQVDKIISGAEANVFISAQPRWIKKLQDNGLIDVYSRANIARNKLVIATPKNIVPFEINSKNKDKNKKLMPFGDEEFKFGFPDAGLLAEGGYLIESVTMLGLERDLKMHYSLFKDSDSMAHAIEEFGFYGAMFETDTYLHPKLHTASIFPEDSHSPITYQAVVVAGEHMDEARRFIAYLNTAEAKSIFARFGFSDVAQK
jgi:molybdate transport system substrate-binding protein